MGYVQWLASCSAEELRQSEILRPKVSSAVQHPWISWHASRRPHTPPTTRPNNTARACIIRSATEGFARTVAVNKAPNKKIRCADKSALAIKTCINLLTVEPTDPLRQQGNHRASTLAEVRRTLDRCRPRRPSVIKETAVRAVVR